MNTLRYVIISLAMFLLPMSCVPQNVEDVGDDPVVEQPSDDDEKPEDKEEEIPEQPSDDGVWETAAEAVANMGVGWNLGNTLDSWDSGKGREGDWLFWETYWGQSRTTPELLQMMKNAGFGAVRVPVTWGIHMDADNNVVRAWMDRVHEIVDYVLDAGLYCIVNIHHDTGADEDVWLLAGMDEYAQVLEKYTSLWTQIAEEFKDYGSRLLFESYNEMLDSRRSWCFASFNGGYDKAFADDAYNAINAYAQTFVDVVRSTGGNNASRNLIVNTYGACCGSGTWNTHLKDPLIYMQVPEDSVKDHIIFEVHSYPGIDNMKNMRAEVEDMFNAIDMHLLSKGVPVILGEWGTSSESPKRDDKVEFLSYFVKKAMEYGIAPFYWMGLSDGVARSLPVFSEPDYAKAILKAYHGESYEPVLPVLSDYDCTYVVEYTSQWGELNLSSQNINLDEYSYVYLKLKEDPGNGDLSIKVYGEGDTEQYESVKGSEMKVFFDKASLGKVSPRITLQYMKTGTYRTEVQRACLVRKDGTIVELNVSVFWGCQISMNAVLK